MPSHRKRTSHKKRGTHKRGKVSSYKKNLTRQAQDYLKQKGKSFVRKAYKHSGGSKSSLSDLGKAKFMIKWLNSMQRADRAGRPHRGPRE